MAIGAVAQPPAMPTIPVANFTRLENQLNSALASTDPQSAGSVLSEDFEEWTPQPPGSPIARDEWLKRGNKSLAQARIHQMAVKEIGDYALVDFVLTAGSKQFFIVDLWHKQGSGWKMQERYRSAIDKAAYRSAPALPPRKD